MLIEVPSSLAPLWAKRAGNGTVCLALNFVLVRVGWPPSFLPQAAVGTERLVPGGESTHHPIKRKERPPHAASAPASPALSRSCSNPLLAFALLPALSFSSGRAAAERRVRVRQRQCEQAPTTPSVTPSSQRGEMRPENDGRRPWLLCMPVPHWTRPRPPILHGSIPSCLSVPLLPPCSVQNRYSRLPPISPSTDAEPKA